MEFLIEVICEKKSDLTIFDIKNINSDVKKVLEKNSFIMNDLLITWIDNNVS
jgi:hypothetical protein